MEGVSNASYSEIENGSMDTVSSQDSGSSLPSQPSTLSSQGSNIGNPLQSFVTPYEPLEILNPSQLTANAQANIPPLMSVATHVPSMAAPPTPTPANVAATLHPVVVSSPVSLPQVVEASTSEGPTTMDTGEPPQAISTPVKEEQAGSLGQGGNIAAAMSLGKARVSQGKVMDEGSSRLSITSDGETENDNGYVVCLCLCVPCLHGNHVLYMWLYAHVFTSLICGCCLCGSHCCVCVHGCHTKCVGS